MSAWDSHKTTFLHKRINRNQIVFNELQKIVSPIDNRKKGSSIIKTSDLSLEALMKIDPDVIGAGTFAIFSKPIRPKR